MLHARYDDVTVQIDAATRDTVNDIYPRKAGGIIVNKEFYTFVDGSLTCGYCRVAIEAG